MPLPKARNRVKCNGCGIEIHPLLFRYLFVTMGWRGRPTPRPHFSAHWTLCGPCADNVVQAVRPYLPESISMDARVQP